MQNKNIYDICAPRRLFVFLHSKQVFMKNLFLFLAIVTFNLSFSQQWKEMANDININLYDVVAEAEAYFENMLLLQLQHHINLRLYRWPFPSIAEKMKD